MAGHLGVGGVLAQGAHEQRGHAQDHGRKATGATAPATRIAGQTPRAAAQNMIVENRAVSTKPTRSYAARAGTFHSLT